MTDESQITMCLEDEPGIVYPCPDEDIPEIDGLGMEPVCSAPADPGRSGERMRIRRRTLRSGVFGNGRTGDRAPGVQPRARPAAQRCIPHRYTVRSSTFLKMTFSTVIPMRITVNRPANTWAVSRFWLFS